MKLEDCIKKYLTEAEENKTTVLPPVEDSPDAIPETQETPETVEQANATASNPAVDTSANIDLDFKASNLGTPITKPDVSINTKEDIQKVIDSVKMLWKFGVMNDSVSIQKLIDPKHWEKFAKNNYFRW